MTGGSLYSVALFDVGRTGVGSLTMSGGATLTSDVSIRAGILESNGQGTINLINGTITAGNSAAGGNIELNLDASVATAQTRAIRQVVPVRRYDQHTPWCERLGYPAGRLHERRRYQRLSHEWC